MFAHLEHSLLYACFKVSDLQPTEQWLEETMKAEQQRSKKRRVDTLSAYVTALHAQAIRSLVANMSKFPIPESIHHDWSQVQLLRREFQSLVVRASIQYRLKPIRSKTLTSFVARVEADDLVVDVIEWIRSQHANESWAPRAIKILESPTETTLSTLM